MILQIIDFSLLIIAIVSTLFSVYIILLVHDLWYVPFTSGKEEQGNHTTHYHHAIFSCSDNLSTLQFIYSSTSKELSPHWLKLFILYTTMYSSIFFFKKMYSLETTALELVIRLVVLNLLHSSMLLTCIQCRALLAGCYWLI